MFERFTRSARTAVTAAQEVARQAGADHIDSGHVLVGAATVRDGVAARALARLGIEPASLAEGIRALGPASLDAEALAGVGIDLGEVRAQAERTFGPGALDTPGRPRAGHLPFDPGAKKLLEVSLREAIRLSSKRIDTGHLLLAAARLDGTPGASALQWFGHDRAAVEAAVRAAWDEGASE